MDVSLEEPDPGNGRSQEDVELNTLFRTLEQPPMC